MPANEIPLVAFTLLGQISFGLIWSLAIIKLSHSGFRKYNTQAFFNIGFLISFVLLIAALAVSFLHLGKPQNAVKAINNLESSWLSREILAAIIFAFSLFIMNLLIRLQSQNIIKTFFFIITFLSGFFFIFSMSELYRLPTVPSWYSFKTYIDFFASGIISGGLILALISGYKSTKFKSEQQFRSFYNTLFGSVIFFILLDLFFMYFFANPDIKKLRDPDNILYLMKIIQTILIIIVLIILVYKISRIRTKTKPPGKKYMITVFILMLIAEIISRFVFYQSYVSLGM